MKIWQRFLFQKLSQTILFFVSSLFILYILIDLSLHGLKFFSKTTFLQIILYYFNSFFQFLDLFLSLSFLFAILKVLLDLNIHKELLALQMAGISKKKILLPCFICASCLSLSSLVNHEWIKPKMSEEVRSFKMKTKSKENKKKPSLYSVPLQNGDSLVFASFDEKKNLFFDLFWVISAKEFWHMKELDIDSKKAKFATHFEKDPSQKLNKTESFTEKTFQNLRFEKDAFFSSLIPYENRPISKLFLSALKKTKEKSSLFTYFFYQCMSSFFPFLLLFLLAPFLFKETRNLSHFVIASASICAFLALKTILDGMLILGENQVFAPYIAIFLPFLLLASFRSNAFLKL